MGLRSDKCVIHCQFEETSLGFVYPAGTSHQKLLRISSKLSVQEIGTKRSKQILFKMLKTQYSGHVYWRYKLTYLVDDFTFLKCICNVM